MKKLLYILLLIPTLAFPANYYVNSAGSGTGDGSLGDPFKELSEIVAIRSSLAPGDSVLFNRGGTFIGSLYLFGTDGTNSNPVVFGAYGTGDKPIISGFTTASSWVDVGDGLFRSEVAASRLKSHVTLDGELQDQGRTAYFEYESHTLTSIYDPDLTIDPTGMVAVIDNRDWLLSNRPITSYSGDNLNFTESLLSTTLDNRTYFLQGDTSLCNSLGDWTADGTYLYMYFGSNNPDDYTVKATTEDSLFHIVNTNYWKFENLEFQGANNYGIKTNNGADYLKVENVDFKYCGNGLLVSGNNSEVRNCEFSDIANMSIENVTKRVVINNITINDNAQLEGQMWDDDGGVGIRSTSPAPDSCQIKYITINKCGYHGIDFRGDSTEVAYFYIDSTCNVKTDGGGVYTANSTDKSRWVHDGIITNSGSVGLYLDEYADSVRCENITIDGADFGGVNFHKASNNTLNNITVINAERQMRFNTSATGVDDDITNSNIQNNIFISENDEYIVYYDSQKSDISASGLNNTIDNNYYIDNSTEDDLYFARYDDGGFISTTTFAAWNALGYDLNTTIQNVEPDLQYNAAASSVQINFSGQYKIDARGVRYNNSIILEPFESVVFVESRTIPSKPAWINSSGKIWINKAGKSWLE